MILAPVLVLFALAGEPRPDCDFVEVTGDTFYDVCGRDREALSRYRKRILLAGKSIEALRQLRCDIETERNPLRAIVMRDLEYTVSEIPNSEDNIVSLVEAGLAPFLMTKTIPHITERALLRLERVMRDPHAEDVSRCWAVGLLHSLRGSRAFADDPRLPCAALFLADELTDEQRRVILGERDHPLYLAVLFQGRPDGPRPDLLCSLASERGAPEWAREKAIGQLTKAESWECLKELLRPDNWFVSGSHHSVELIFDALGTFDYQRAQALASTFDASCITDLEMRIAVEDALFDLRTFDPELPYYDFDAPTPP